MTDRDQLGAEIAHWRFAVEALGDLEMVASPAAWAALELYLHDQVRRRLAGVTRSLKADADHLARVYEEGRPAPEVRNALLRLRGRYQRAETLLDFYGDAVNSRTNPDLGQLLQGYDVIATDSMATILRPLGIESPPALVYQDKGLGASILRGRLTLCEQSHPPPAPAIKLTRHNLSIPTSLLHETGHQVLALTGYNEELREKLKSTLARWSTRIAGLVSSWSSEIGADVHAVHHAGWAPVFALANVVDGPSSHVFRMRPGDPHPSGLVRVIFNCRLLRSWYGPGTWDDLEATWLHRHPIETSRDVAPETQGILEVIDEVVDITSKSPMRSFKGASFGEILDPRRVSPDALRSLEKQAGETLLTSTYLQRQEPIRILALLALRSLDDPEQTTQHRKTLVDWVSAIGRTASGISTRAA